VEQTLSKKKKPLPGQDLAKSLKEALDKVKKIMQELHVAHLGKNKK
jgi:hypothetical protein